jgi:hypothetical protein
VWSRLRHRVGTRLGIDWLAKSKAGAQQEEQ